MDNKFYYKYRKLINRYLYIFSTNFLSHVIANKEIKLKKRSYFLKFLEHVKQARMQRMLIFNTKIEQQK